MMGRPPNPIRLFGSLAILAGTSTATSALFDHSNAATAFNDWSSMGHESFEVDLPFVVPVCGGEFDEVHVHAYGGLGFFEIGQDVIEFDDMDDNFAIVPFWLKTLSGETKFEISDPAGDFSARDNAVNAFIGSGTFATTNEFVTTWIEVQNELDTSQINTFQASIVVDETDPANVATFAIFNFDRMDFTDGGVSGYFVNSDEVNTCYNYLNGLDYDATDLLTGTNCGTPGRWVVRIDTQCKCANQFTSACGDELVEGDWTIETPIFTIVNGTHWDYVIMYECKPTFEMLPGVTTKTSSCIYDADYYESRWALAVPPACHDFTIAYNYLTQLTIIYKDGSPIEPFIITDPTDPGYDAFGDSVDEALSEILDWIGLDDTDATEVTVKRKSIEIYRELSDDPGVMIIEFLVAFPLHGISVDEYIKALREAIQQRAFNSYTLTDANAYDLTEPCLTACLGCKDKEKCGLRPPPLRYDTCCGTCSSADYSGGTPYSRVLHSCCNDSIVFNPETHVCCEFDDGSGATYGVFQADNCADL